ncbi:hypothetical protein Pint_25286 [Pistacia integerrima]|uniref:Uncharacterized protein n=1 Tax=Pistacia integerrima TaxID=434235 RepID=A0ACC0YDL0_9ROSI|nr:hypothetical protein Pint_25286 [Pistacia integerrima]
MLSVHCRRTGDKRVSLACRKILIPDSAAVSPPALFTVGVCVDKNLKYRCQSFWKNQFALWVVFEPERDANHGEIFLPCETGRILP